MKLKIYQVGEPVLRQKARPLSPEEILSDEIQRLIELMRDTMRDARGVGLAAPQIGLPFQLAVIEDPEVLLQELPPELLAERGRAAIPFHVVINPRLFIEPSDEIEFFEGCLSLTGFTALVARGRAVRVECLNEGGEGRTINARGWYARILQHEIDHLNGRLYIDRMITETFMSVDNYQRHWRDAPIDELRSLLMDSSAQD